VESAPPAAVKSRQLAQHTLAEIDVDLLPPPTPVDISVAPATCSPDAGVLWLGSYAA